MQTGNQIHGAGTPETFGTGNSNARVQSIDFADFETHFLRTIAMKPSERNIIEAAARQQDA